MVGTRRPSPARVDRLLDNSYFGDYKSTMGNSQEVLTKQNLSNFTIKPTYLKNLAKGRPTLFQKRVFTLIILRMSIVG